MIVPHLAGRLGVWLETLGADDMTVDHVLHVRKVNQVLTVTTNGNNRFNDLFLQGCN